MASNNPIVLLLEDCPTTGLIVERAVMHELPEVRLLWACSLAEAAARVEGLDVDLFLVDIGLPDGNGLDFLWQMTMERPKARAIVMTATPMPEHAAHSEALGVLHFLEKPVQIRPLIDHIRTALGDPVVPNEAGTDFQANLKNVTPADVLQLKCLSGATTIVEFHSDARVGRIRFDGGEITDASAGILRGADAVFEIVGWKQGQVSEHPCVGFSMRTIESSWQNLLMDAAQRIDERRRAGAAIAVA